MKGLAFAMIALVLGALTSMAAAASAQTDCTDTLAWPSFAELAPTARSIYLVRVTRSVDGIAVTARPGEVVRGDAPGHVDLRRLQPGRTSDGCPAPIGPYARVGDRLLIAYDGIAPDGQGRIDAIALVGPMSDRRNLSALERLTLKEARAYDAPGRHRFKRPKETPLLLEGSVDIDELPISTTPSMIPDDDVLWSCGGAGPGFPRSVLDGPIGVERAKGAVFDGLRRALRTMRGEFDFEPREDRPYDLPWLLAFQGEERALFLVRRFGDRERYSVMSVRRKGGTWGFGGYGDECHLRPVITHGLGSSEWRIAESKPPASGSSTLSVEVIEAKCASGRPADGRIADPFVEYGEDAITITIGVRRVEGFATCQGNPWTPYIFELDELIGDRLLLDGGPWPPQQRWPIP